MRGVSTRQTPLGWTVIRVHYTADADKDPSTPAGSAWYALARKGMRDRDWRKEYEIDYRALSGQLVFPEMDESIHVVHPFRLDPRWWTCWLGCDPHPRTAHAFVWLAVNREGEKVVPYSYWPKPEDEGVKRLTVPEYAESIKLIEASPLVIPARYRVMDVAGKAFNADEERNYFDMYQDAGLFFNPAKRNRDNSGFDLISEALRLKPYGEEKEERPMLTIMAGCGDNDFLIHKLKTIRFREWKQVMTDKDPPEEVEDKEKHLIDGLSYILLDEPRFVDPSPIREEYTPLYPGLGR